MNLKPIPQLPDYEISDKGDIWSHKTAKFLSPFINNKGRYVINLWVEGKSKGYLVSRLMAVAFGLIDDLNSPLEIDHIDGNALNNKLSNLQALTHKEHLDKTIIEDRGYKFKPKCSICGKITRAQSGICRACTPPSIDISVDQIIYWVTNYSWVRASKELGLSDVGLRKRYFRLTGEDPKTLKRVRVRMAM